MTEIRHETAAACSVDDAWKVIGEFGDLSWFPGVGEVSVEGDVRVIPMGDLEIRERLVRRDDDARLLVYSIDNGSAMGLSSHEAAIQALPEGEGCRLVYTCTVEPAEAAEMMDPVYGGALASLKERVEG